MKINGIDVSKHQGTIDWAKVKADGVQFAILRAGYGREISQKDVKFEEYYAGCKANGIPVGAYWYSYCDSVEDAVREAKTCLEAIKGKQFEYPVYFDLEESSQFSKGKTFCSEIVKAFCDTLESAGYFAGLYISRSPLMSHITPEVRNRYALWIAEYNSKCNYDGDYGIWQKSDTGKVAGISGYVDMDECYVDYPTIIKSSGHNGFVSTNEPSKVTAPVKSVEEIAKEVIDGKWGNGEARKADLSKAGYDYAAIQEKVNQLVSPAYTEYTVKKGDTLWDIATEFLGSGSYYKEIMKASGVSSESIYPGQKLKIPKM